MRKINEIINLQFGERDVQLRVDMRLIETVERVYDCNIDIVAAIILSNPMKIKLSQLASVFIEWMTNEQITFIGGRDAVKEYIYMADEQTLRMYVGAVQGACLFCRNHITADEMSELAAGNDIGQEEVADKKK